MASTPRAARALIFMQQCRQPSRLRPLVPPSTRAASDISHLSPSNFSKHLRGTATTPFPAASSSPTNPPPSWSYPSARPIQLPPPKAYLTPWQRFKMYFGYKPPVSAFTPAPFYVHNNPYRARKTWPPDFTKLHAKQQFHYEKTYRRRAKLKWERPNWNRWTKLVQHTLIVTVTIYFVFICEPTDGLGTPFDGFRAWFFGKMKTLGRLPDEMQGEAERLEAEARARIPKRPDAEA